MEDIVAVSLNFGRVEDDLTAAPLEVLAILVFIDVEVECSDFRCVDNVSFGSAELIKGSEVIINAIDLLVSLCLVLVDGGKVPCLVDVVYNEYLVAVENLGCVGILVRVSVAFGTVEDGSLIASLEVCLILAVVEADVDCTYCNCVDNGAADFIDIEEPL